MKRADGMLSYLIRRLILWFLFLSSSPSVHHSLASQMFLSRVASVLLIPFLFSIILLFILRMRFKGDFIMSKLIPGNQKHLPLDDRLFIASSLNEDRSFKDISKFLCKDPTTISKEIRLHRMTDTHHKGSFTNKNNFCIHRFRCKKTNVCEKIVICQGICRACPKCNQVCPRFESKPSGTGCLYQNDIQLHRPGSPSYKKCRSKTESEI